MMVTSGRHIAARRKVSICHILLIQILPASRAIKNAQFTSDNDAHYAEWYFKRRKNQSLSEVSHGNSWSDLSLLMRFLNRQVSAVENYSACVKKKRRKKSAQHDHSKEEFPTMINSCKTPTKCLYIFVFVFYLVYRARQSLWDKQYGRCQRQSWQLQHQEALQLASSQCRSLSNPSIHWRPVFTENKCFCDLKTMQAE